MAMSAFTLATQLATLVPVATEAEARQKLVNAYATFANDAQAPVPILPTGVALGKAAMLPALIGMNTPGNGAIVIANAIIAFWVAVAAGLAVSFTAATAITPPPHASVLSSLNAVFASNLASKANLIAATTAVANVLYAQAIIGGTVTVGVATSPIL